MGTLEMQPDTTNTAQDATTDQQKLVRDFFLRDSAPELIESLNTLVEAYLFTPSLASITPEMREHIVNQLRVAALIAKLDASNRDIVKHSPPL